MNEQTKKALVLLKSYSCIESRVSPSESEKQELESCIKLIVNLSDDQNFGICASNFQEALNSLKNYLIAFDYNVNIEIECPETLDKNKPIYLKFSTERQSYHVSNYSGNYRGVLITIFTDSYDEIIGTYGHFPLNLF